MANLHNLMARAFAASLALMLVSIAPAASETYNEWTARLKVPDTKRGLNDDPAGDGVPNVLKYALALDPLVATTNPVPAAEVTSVQGADRLVLNVRKNPDAMGIDYIVEASPDLATWSTSGLIVLSNTSTTLSVADGTPLTTGVRRFMRLRVALLDPLPGILNWSQVTAIHAVMDRAIASYQIPGIVYSIKPAGKDPWLDARGVADTTTRAPASASARFRIGSASKTFIGMAALQLIQQKRMGFDDPISRYLPAKVLSNYKRDVISIRMLLQHTSGINNYTNIEDAWGLPYIFNRQRVWTNEELVELINARYAKVPEDGGKVAEPGQTWFYSNTNTVTLAMIVEKISGLTIREYITTNFVDRLRLRDTIYPAPGLSTIPGEHLTGYMDWQAFTGSTSFPAGMTDVTIYDPTGVGPAGPIISTVRDLSVWVEALAHDESLIGDFRRGHVDWRYFVNAAREGGAGVTYGMNIAHEPDGINQADYFIVGHRGQISGYDTSMMYLPDKDVAIVVVCNRSLPPFDPRSPNNSNEVALDQIVALLYPDLIAASKINVGAAASQATRARAAALQTDAATDGRRAFRGPLTEYR